MPPRKKTVALTEEQQKLMYEYRFVSDWVVKRFYHICRCESDINDMKSICYIAICKCTQHFKPEMGPFKTYAVKSCIRAVMAQILDHNLIRTTRKSRDISYSIKNPLLDHPDYNFATKKPDSVIQEFRESFECLTGEENEIIRLRLDGLKYRTIADIVGMSREWVRNTEHKAHDKIRDLLEWRISGNKRNERHFT